MRILFRYILREVVFSSLIGTLLFTFVLFLKAVGPLIELLIRPSGSTGDVVQLFWLAVVQTLRWAHWLSRSGMTAQRCSVPPESSADSVKCPASPADW